MYDKKLTPKQKNIAKAAPPYNKINGKDFTALRSSNDKSLTSAVKAAKKRSNIYKK